MLKPKTNVIVYELGHYLNQHAIGIAFKNGVSNIILTNGILYWSLSWHRQLNGQKVMWDQKMFNIWVQHAKNKYYIGPGILFKYGMEYKISY